MGIIIIIIRATTEIIYARVGVWVCVCARLYTRLVWSHGRDESLSAKSSSEFVCDQEPISKTRKPAMMYQYIIITRRFPSVCAPHNGAWAQRDALVVRKNYVRWRLRFSDKIHNSSHMTSIPQVHGAQTVSYTANTMRWWSLRTWLWTSRWNIFKNQHRICYYVSNLPRLLLL